MAGAVAQKDQRRVLPDLSLAGQYRLCRLFQAGRAVQQGRQYRKRRKLGRRPPAILQQAVVLDAGNDKGCQDQDPGGGGGQGAEIPASPIL